MIQLEVQNHANDDSTPELNLSDVETKAYEDAYFSMLLELGSDEEVDEFLSRTKSGA